MEKNEEEMNDRQKIRYKTLRDMHRAYLEALRSREGEIIRFIAILAPALAGFIWLLKLQLIDKESPELFVVGTVGILFVLLLGAMYALALGYNYRYIILQIAKLELDGCLGVRNDMLRGWQITRPQDCVCKYCMPPEIIKVFWWAFIVGMVLIIIAVNFVMEGCICCTPKAWIFGPGLIFLLFALLAPFRYGCKLEKLYKTEKNKDWQQSKTSPD